MRRRRLASVLLTLCVPAALLAMSCSKNKPAAIMAPEMDAPKTSLQSKADAGRMEDPEAIGGLAGAVGGRKALTGKIAVCHVDELGEKHVINISRNAWPAHSAHGDVQLVDADGDGWVQAVNGCVPGGDCDDQNPDVHGGNTELCDGVDNDCNGQVDEGLPVIGTQSADIQRDPTRLAESAMGNLVADAMRARYSGVDAAIVNSGTLRQDLRFSSVGTGEAPGEITCGELFAVLPFGNRTVILTLTGAQLEQAFLNGLLPPCGTISGGTGRTPQISGLKVSYHCNGQTPVIDGMWKTPHGIGGPQIPIGPTDTVRLVTNDFMAGGGDGYAVLMQGTNVVQAGETVLRVLADYVAANSPVSAAVQGRIVVTP